MKRHRKTFIFFGGGEVWPNIVLFGGRGVGVWPIMVLVGGGGRGSKIGQKIMVQYVNGPLTRCSFNFSRTPHFVGIHGHRHRKRTPPSRTLRLYYGKIRLFLEWTDQDHRRIKAQAHGGTQGAHVGNVRIGNLVLRRFYSFCADYDSFNLILVHH